MKNIYPLLLLAFLLAGCKASEQMTSSEVSKEDNKSPYEKIVTEKTETDPGLFTVHRNEEKYYLEIPDSLLGRDMLLVSRLVALPSGFGGGYVNAGSKTNEQVVKWEKSDNRIFLRSVSFNSVASDSLPIHASVVANNLQPILYSFTIEGNAPKTGNILIEVTDLFKTDVPALSPLNTRMRKAYEVKKLDADRTFIQGINSFPLNIEVRHELTFEANNPPEEEQTGTLTFLMNQSMVLLPDDQMEKRPYDERVGWFTVSQIDYGSPLLKADEKRFIRKWDLVPKDKEAYFRGELVEPVKPIVYYLDPATPAKWRPYFKAGIELWQKAFEAAGFKNAIIAKDPPTPEEDPEFSPEDVRYSVVRYVASTTRNAMGPSVSDPRSGEIIESDIIWYHNHLRSYRNRYLLETGAANPSARTLNTSDKDIGEMMKMVIAHEVGHSLGLPHNMKASAAYPVDSLRSGKFTQKYGIAASIMDYARYNYIAQPGDENIRFVRQLGPYDLYAINWGYRYLPDDLTRKEKRQELDSWILEKAGDPMYRFGSGYNDWDPDSQTEGIGKDPVRASEYGLSNLKIVAENLPEWTETQGENYDDLAELYDELVGVWNRYVGHVITLIGGVHHELKAVGQDGQVYSEVDADQQERAVKFLNDHVFTDQEWLIRSDILQQIEPQGALETVRNVQERALSRTLETDRLVRLTEAQALYGIAYGPVDLMNDLRQGIWREIISSNRISPQRRGLQRMYIDLLGKMINPEPTGSHVASAAETDVQALARAQLVILHTDIQNAKSRMSDDLSRYHLSDCIARIEKILDIES